MDGIEDWLRPVYPLERWVDVDPRLQGAGDLGAALLDIVNVVYGDIIPEEEPDADLLPAPMELALMLREAAAQIEEWTNRGLTL